MVNDNNGNPIAGVTVMTSLDGVSATTDANGYSFLQTTTPEQGGSTNYGITVQANGFTAGGGVMNWGDHPTGQTFQLSPSV